MIFKGLLLYLGTWWVRYRQLQVSRARTCLDWRGAGDARSAGACIEPYQWWLTFGATKPCLQKAAINIFLQILHHPPMRRELGVGRLGHDQAANSPHTGQCWEARRHFSQRGIRKMETVDLNAKYITDVKAMLLEHSIGHWSESKSVDSSDSSNSSDSNSFLSCIV